MPTDPEVVACTARHSTAPVAKCADCGICDECDVTLQQDANGQVRCEVCQTAEDDRREDADTREYYTTIRSLR